MVVNSAFEKTLEEKEQELDALAQEIYQAGEHRIEPIYPWVLVRIMPKEQVRHGIHLPEKQNRLFYEGIVLATWKPFLREYTGDLKWSGEVEVINKQVWMRSHVEVGDRVVFMHFEGQPHPYLDELHYRMIHEIETHPNGGIWGKLHLKEDEGLQAKLDKLFKNKTSVTISGK